MKDNTATQAATKDQPDAKGPVVAGTPGTDIKAPNGALMVMDYGNDVGAGLENISSDEISIPFISKLHYVCPQVDPTEAKYIPDAKPGMLLVTSTGEVFDGLTVGMDFIPCHRDKNFVEFEPNRGGFVSIKSSDDPLVLDLLKKQGRFKKLIMADGHELTETKYIYGLFMPTPDYVFPGVLGLSSLQIKRYVAFMDVITKIKYPAPNGEMVNPPMWAHRWHLKTVPDSNKKGKFFSYHLSLVNGAKLPQPIDARLDRNKPADEALYQRASALYQSIKSGRAEAAYETGGDSVSAGDDIPF